MSGFTYAAAGVDADVKARLLADLAPAIASTHSAAVAAGVGAFAGAVHLPAVSGGLLLATTDGVGTKTLVARRLGLDAVIGADVVSHCANDLAAHGARPLAFLDYIAMARLDPDLVRALVEAMARACAELGVVLLGGETAEMPGVYCDDAYDVVGTMVGLAPAGGLVTGRAVAPGDRVLGLASSGLHTNGYSLARAVLDEVPGALDEPVDDSGLTVGEALLAPHRCYARALHSLLEAVPVRAMAHITGGGLPGNLVRVLPEGCRARLRRAWPEPPIFGWLQRAGRIPDDEMVGTFNLGVGMAVIVPSDEAASALAHLEATGGPGYEIGEIVEGPRGVEVA